MSYFINKAYPHSSPNPSCGQNLKSRQKTGAEENGNPNPQNFVSIFLSPHSRVRITTLVERGN